MAFSLSSWFKGKPEDSAEESAPANTPPGKVTSRAPAPAPAPATPPPSVARTVLPSGAGSGGNGSPVSLRSPGAPRPAGSPPTTRNLPVRPPARKVSFPVPATVPTVPVPSVAAPGSIPPPPISMTPPPAPVMPPAPEVSVRLEVGDFIDRLPPGFLQPGSFDRQRVVEFQASELYSDLSKGRASVPASTIYAKCPEIFARPVTDTEDVEIQLPLQKLVEQLSAAFQTRTDQIAEENVGEIETPFLQVAKEDNARLSRSTGNQGGALRPPVELPAAAQPEATAGLPARPPHRTGSISTITAKPAPELPPAPTLAPPTSAPINPGKRPPSTVRASVAGGKIRLSGPATINRMSPVSAGPPVVKSPGDAPAGGPGSQIPAPPSGPASSPSHQVAKKTARITIPPISLRAPGTGATPRPGAIPPPPSLPVQPSPVAIRPAAGAETPVTFRSSPPPPVKLPPPSFAPPRPTIPPPAFPAMPAGVGAPPPAAPTPVAAPTPSVPAVADDRKIELGLAAVLRGQPAETLTVEPSDVPDDVRFTLPFASIEKQLSTGRVSIPRQTFVDALPEAHRHVLADDSEGPDVQIPLQEVFQNLPGNALSMRTDQVSEEVGIAYPTPFSQKAEEDAQRLGMSAAAAPVAPAPEAAVEAPAPEVEAAAVIPEPVQEETSDESFGAVFEESASPAPVTEEAPLAEMPVAEEAPARDLPLDLAETFGTEPAQEETPIAGQPEETLAPVQGIHPSEPVVEPPVAAEPPPVAEALAVLESTAPAESDREVAPEAAPQPAPAVEMPPVPTPGTAPVSARSAGVSTQDSELQTLFMTEEELDAKSVVRLVCQLPGVTGCAVMFADGLRLAGNFPAGDAEGFSAMAPPFFKRTSNFVGESSLGTLDAVTLYTDRGLLSFFLHEDICVSVRHTGRGFLPGVREKLAVVTRELARMYSSEKPAQPGDHSL